MIAPARNPTATMQSASVARSARRTPWRGRMTNHHAAMRTKGEIHPTSLLPAERKQQSTTAAPRKTAEAEEGGGGPKKRTRPSSRKNPASKSSRLEGSQTVSTQSGCSTKNRAPTKAARSAIRLRVEAMRTAARKSSAPVAAWSKALVRRKPKGFLPQIEASIIKLANCTGRLRSISSRVKTRMVITSAKFPDW